MLATLWLIDENTGEMSKPAVRRAIRRVKHITSPVLGRAVDSAWATRLSIYRLSRRRWGYSPQLYRAMVSTEGCADDPGAGMTSVTERAYFHWHAREVYRGAGAIVDLGAGFGSTTAALARGLVRNPRSAAGAGVIHAFDRFKWEPWMAGYAAGAGVSDYKPGDSFVTRFEASVAAWRGRIETHEGDLLEQTWREGPIELLLIDAMKSWPLATKISTEFFPALLPGAGYIIHQDFAHCYTPWIHLVNYRLRDKLAPVLDVQGSETAVFLVLEPLGADVAQLDLRRSSFDDDEIAEAFEYSLRTTNVDHHSGIRAASVFLAITDGDFERAQRALRALEGSHALSPFHADAMRNALHEAELTVNG